MYHLEIIESLPCTDEKLAVFSRAHYCYINQIFGDRSVRKIIQTIMHKEGFRGRLLVKKGEAEFANSEHHIFRPGRSKNTQLCSVQNGYQNLNVNVNDTLCQSYSLMNYLQIPFDKTPSKFATPVQKHDKQMAMIDMYRMLLKNKELVKEIGKEILHTENNKLWIDDVNHEKPFFIIEKYKTMPKIVKNIQRVLDVWELYGWRYFIETGMCKKK
jgi:hypothetical protein